MRRSKLLTKLAAIESAKWPRVLAPIPREDWSEQRPGSTYPVEAFRSQLFMVQIFNEPSGLRMSVNRTNLIGWNAGHPLWRDGITWDELQRLKSEAGYGHLWGVECYPSDAKVVNVANMRHLWLLPAAPAFGWNS